MTATSPPQDRREVSLADPGAGLPPWEGWFFRHLGMPLFSGLMSRDAALRKFDREGRRALELARNVPPSRLSEPVLIDRITGIEDSSRHWSIAMTLQHLIIVGKGIRLTVKALNQGKVPDREVRIQDVKPDPTVGPEILEAFASWLDDYPKGLLELPWPDSPKLAHPWFGPLSADRWFKLNALHHGIHRKQIEAIVAGLPPRHESYAGDGGSSFVCASL